MAISDEGKELPNEESNGTDLIKKKEKTVLIWNMD